MKARLVAGTILLFFGRTAFAHRLDEYLQATTLSVEKDRVRAQIRLVPGVSVFPAVLAAIDSDGDGALSEAEQRAYAERVLRDLSLAVDGQRVPLRVVSSQASTTEAMRYGLGEIRLELAGEVPRGAGPRRLVFENHHRSGIAAYLVNALVPTDPAIRITAQDRNYDQSFYRVDYVQSADGRGASSGPSWSGAGAWLGAAALLLSARLYTRMASSSRRPARAANDAVGGG